MAEYTPDDDHMRSLFCQGYAQGDFNKHDQAWAAWEKWLAAHDARVRRHAWQEGYDQGAEDGITSEQMQVGIGLGGIARPARTNPYEETP